MQHEDITYFPCAGVVRINFPNSAHSILAYSICVFEIKKNTNTVENEHYDLKKTLMNAITLYSLCFHLPPVTIKPFFVMTQQF